MILGDVKAILNDEVNRVRGYATVATIYRHVIENKDGSDFNELAVKILEGNSKMALIIFNFFPTLSLHTPTLFLMISHANDSYGLFNLPSLFSLNYFQ